MKKTVLCAAILCAVSPVTFAKSVTVVGTVPVVVEMQSATRHARSLVSRPASQVFSLQHIKLSANAKKHLKYQVHQALQTAHLKPSAHQSLPSSMEVSMNNTPVLNQGAHGSCVTFANTGAIDAILEKGDYISQLCSLSLGKYLENEDANYPSGWDGSWGPIVLKQLFKYGIVNMDTQHQASCGGMTDYPVYNPNTGTDMSTTAYQDMSESIDNKISWTTVLDEEDAYSDNYNPDEVLYTVKESLAKGERLTFGVGLDVAMGGVGALGSYHAHHDTWVLTPEIEDDVNSGEIYAGHEMILIGYDDDATVTADDGTVNKGLLHLRNSWSEGAGDHGDYYMSYAHFKALTMEVQTITPATN